MLGKVPFIHHPLFKYSSSVSFFLDSSKNISIVVSLFFSFSSIFCFISILCDCHNPKTQNNRNKKWTTGNAYEYDGTSDDWHAIKNPKGCGLVESVFSVEPGKAYLCGSNGMIYYTNDYGNNWEERKKDFDRKEDAVKPLIGQWIKTSEFDFDGTALRFAYLAEKDYVYTLFILKSVDGGRTFALESDTKLPNIAKAIAFNGKNGISVYNTDGSLDFYIMK